MKPIFLLSIIFFIGFLSAVYPGETLSFNNTIGSDKLNYTIINNDTLIEGLIVNITLEEITITLPFNLPPGSFEILFEYNESEQVVIIPSSSSGGGSSHHHKTNQTNQSIQPQSFPCTLNKEMCSGDNVYVCVGAEGWKFKEACPDGCLEDKCVIALIPDEPVSQTTPIIKDNRLKNLLTILIGVVLLAVLSILYFKIIRKRKKDGKLHTNKR